MNVHAVASRCRPRGIISRVVELCGILWRYSFGKSSHSCGVVNRFSKLYARIKASLSAEDTSGSILLPVTECAIHYHR